MKPFSRPARALLPALACLPALLLPLHAQSAAPDIRKLKRAVVNIEADIPLGLHDDKPGEWIGTGFVVDAQRGLIVTNRHVSSRSPAQYTVHFYNGQTTHQVVLLYYDPWIDFAMLQVSTADLHFPLVAAALGDSFTLQPQDPVFLIGNNAGHEYTVLHGEVINTEQNSGDRHSGDFEVAYRNQGGSSGSPVFNARGLVVGLHYKGDDVTGWEIRIEYVKDALAELSATPGVCVRGEPGCALGLMPISEAEQNFHLPPDIAESLRTPPENIEKMIYVQGIIPEGPAAGRLQPGDLVVDIDGSPVGSNLYKADKLVDARVGGTAQFHVVRNGVEMKIPVPVEDAENGKALSLVQLAGGVFHDVTPELRREYDIDTPGVFLSQAEEGSPFSALGTAPDGSPKNRDVQILAVNGQPTPDLQTFLRVAATLKDGQDINVTIRDFHDVNTGPQVQPLTIDLKFHPLKVFSYSPTTHRWVQRPPPAGVN